MGGEGAVTVPFGEFDLEHLVARGGMGEVWRATHRATGRPVAVKSVRPDKVDQPRFVEAYEREIRAVAGLDHPRIVEVLAGGVSEDPALPVRGPWFAMELARGTLAEASVQEFVDVRAALDALLAALGHAHARGLLHRDVKPANLLDCGVHARPRWKLADFGLARLGSDRTLGGGTPGFLAPEQASRGREGPWTDLYAVAAVGWALVCGSPPAQGPFVPRVPVPRSFVGWLDRLLARDPMDRWDRAADARAALRATDRDPDLVQVGAFGDPLPSLDASTFVWSDAPAVPAAPPPLRSAAGPGERPPPPDWRAADPPDPVFPTAARLRLRVGGWSLFALRPVPLVGRELERDALWRILREVVRDRSTRRVLLRGPDGIGRHRLATWLAETAHELGVADPEGESGRPALTVVEEADRGPGLDAAEGLAPCANGRLILATAGPGFAWAGAEVVELAPLGGADRGVLGSVLGLSLPLAEELLRSTGGRPGLAVRVVLAGLRQDRWALERTGMRRADEDPLPVLDEEEAALEAHLAADPLAMDRLGLAAAVPELDDAVVHQAAAALGLSTSLTCRSPAFDLLAARAALARGERSGRARDWHAALADALPSGVDGVTRAYTLAGTDRHPDALDALLTALDPIDGLPPARAPLIRLLAARLDGVGAPPCDPGRGVLTCADAHAMAIDVRLSTADRGLEQAERCGWKAAAQVSLRLARADALREAVRLDESLAEASIAVRLAREAGIGPMEARCLTICIPSLCSLGRAREASSLVDRYDAIARSQDDRLWARYYRGFVACSQGDVATAERLLRPLAAELPEGDGDHLVGAVYADLGECARRTGRLDEAAECYRRAAMFTRGRMVADIAQVNLALVHVERGDWGAAEAIVHAARWDPARRFNPFLGAAMAQILALLAAHVGDRAAFDEAWDEVEALLAESGVRDQDFALVADRVAAELDALGDLPRAERARRVARSQR